MHSIQFGNAIIPYEVKWSNRRKTIAIAVNSNGVYVTAPTDTPQEKVASVVYQKAEWIRKQLVHFNEMNDSIHYRLFLAGEKLPYLGRQYRLKIEKGKSILYPSFIFQHGVFIAKLPEDTAEEDHRKILLPLYEHWVKVKGEAFVRNRITRFTVKLQQEPSAIKIKDQQQRWGSCTANGQVLINWRILLAPVSIVDYVLAHELAHLKYMDHSKEFWITLGMLIGDYEERKEWLRVNGKTLYI
ncbi:M48 family metallopeptidase [Lysinibacillus capsici]|uniref:M48 family metallopeptidase n=1 Tax=Lysinibacillus capsici TaxID=2115968 RepID=UPI001CD92ABE|nr:SprT family zinc-dependent metalloprotease [Lysinibacillus capsici]